MDCFSPSHIFIINERRDSDGCIGGTQYSVHLHSRRRRLYWKPKGEMKIAAQAIMTGNARTAGAWILLYKYKVYIQVGDSLHCIALVWAGLMGLIGLPGF
jgi:hypothetical protein